MKLIYVFGRALKAGNQDWGNKMLDRITLLASPKAIYSAGREGVKIKLWVAVDVSTSQESTQVYVHTEETLCTQSRGTPLPMNEQIDLFIEAGQTLYGMTPHMATLGINVGPWA
jgi:hypothetical protein